MRVDLITTELRPGGAERCLTEIALACRRAGWSPRVICLGPLPDPHQQTLVTRLRAGGIEPIPLGGRNRKNPWQGLQVYRGLRRQLRRDPPQVVQTFLFHANVLGLRAAAIERVPRRIAGVRVADTSPIRVAVERWALRNATTVACVSEAVAAFTRKRLVSSGRQPSIVITPNGVALETWQNAKRVDWAEYGISGKGPVLLFVGRLNPQKGLDWLLENLPHIFQAHPKAVLVCVGEGPLRSKLEAAQQRFGEDRLRVLGWQPNVAELMVSATALILPSRYEGMPNVVLEAMAAGLPIVATRAEGVQELLGEQFAEQTVDFGDDQSLRKRIAEVVTDRSLTTRQVEANRHRVIDQFTLEAMTARFLDLYRL